MKYYVLPGINPTPWTAPTGAAVRGSNGGRYVKMHANSEMVVYKETIREEMRRLYPDAPMVNGLIELSFVFNRVLDQGQGRSKRKVADATNMQKATEDALEGVLFANDNQVKRVTSLVVEDGDMPYVAFAVAEHEPPHVPLPDEVVVMANPRSSSLPTHDRTEMEVDF